MNGITLCLEGSIEDDYLNRFDLIYIFIFTFEVIIKIIGLGISSYFKRIQNKVDIFILIISYQETMLSTYYKGFQYLRVFKGIRGLRLFKLLIRIEYLKKIARFIVNSFYSYIFIAVLLLILNYVYGLNGMDLFTNIKVTDSTLKAYSFDDFSSAFICTFNVLIMDNWYNILSVGKNSDAGLFKTALFAVSWIFIGNYILMNLLLAVVLDGLSNELNEQKNDEISEREITNEKNNQKNVSNNKLQITHTSQDYNIEPDKNKLLKQSFCEYSLFIFGKNNFIRKMCSKIVFNKKFEIIIFLLILISNISLIMDTYYEESLLIKYINYIVSLCFTLECLMKIIVQGLIIEKTTYLREIWNQLDFIIVVVFFLDLTLEQLDISWIKVVRILRIVRPLRLISKSSNIKIVVVALLESLNGILKVSLIIFMLWIIFASFGISIYRDRFGYCEDILNFSIGIQDCLPPKIWVDHYIYNFDNIYYAMFTLLTVSTYDGWLPILKVAVNSNSAEYGPTQNNSKYLSYFYFVLFIVVIPIFFINLFTGVIFYHFVTAEKKIKYLLMTESQARWIQMQKLIVALKPKNTQIKPPSNSFRKFFFKLVNHKLFELFIILVISASIINMALLYDDAPQNYLQNLVTVDFLLLLTFTAEIFLKVFALGLRGYFYQDWNKFDFLVVVCGIIDLVMNSLFSEEISFFKIGPKILRALRIFRIGRLLRLMKKFDGIIKLLKTLFFSIPMILNVLGLVLLIFFIYTIIGCSLFYDIYLDEYINFKNFLYGLMTLFKISTLDSWTSTALYFTNKNAYAAIYFVSFILIIHFIATNLFILVLLQQFDESEVSTKNSLEEFREYVSDFRKAWFECTEKFNGKKMSRANLLCFFQKLDEPLGTFFLRYKTIKFLFNQ